jgi:uncharacterized protein (UPF0276 family)
MGMLVPQIGVGLSFQATLESYVFDHADTFDFLEIVPDTLWVDEGAGAAPRYRTTAEAESFLARLDERLPLVAHSIGLSVGSAHDFDWQHVEQMAAWHKRFRFSWHSDHLCFMKAMHGSRKEVNVGLMMPMPCDRESLNLLVPRIRHVQSRVEAPFLIENNVNYFSVPDEEMDEAEFLNRLMEESGCGLLLDLHNIHTNCRNFGTDPYRFLERLNLEGVGEIHLAGGLEMAGMYLDGHDGPCPPEVWAMLDWVLPRTPRAGGVVFEIFNTNYPDFGPEALAGQLGQAREIWRRHRHGSG